MQSNFVSLLCQSRLWALPNKLRMRHNDIRADSKVTIEVVGMRMRSSSNRTFGPPPPHQIYINYYFMKIIFYFCNIHCMHIDTLFLGIIHI